jgi:hypothetical protein
MDVIEMKKSQALKSAIVAAQSLAAVGALVLTVAAPWKWT